MGKAPWVEGCQQSVAAGRQGGLVLPAAGLQLVLYPCWPTLVVDLKMTAHVGCRLGYIPNIRDIVVGCYLCTKVRALMSG
jgi:hypothetical protein